MSKSDVSLSLTGQIEALSYAISLIEQRIKVEAPYFRAVLERYANSLSAILVSVTREQPEQEKNEELTRVDRIQPSDRTSGSTASTNETKDATAPLSSKGPRDMDNHDTTAMTEMPRYRSHKEVWALKIKDIGYHGDSDNGTTGGRITPADEGYAPFEVDGEYMTKHKPHVGGYYVQYKGGYKSFSPADAFEEGYTRL